MMLQRAASNAYSWWWASHIRTKQSKWLEQNLQDMEEKVAHVLKLIEEDGDSFAKRAEMYYKKRPELIHFVEESYKAYRALAERYDHISTELQNANTTIASVFPEQVPFMDDDDEDATPRKFPEVAKANIPKVPKAPVKDLKSILSSTARKLQNKRKKKSPATVSAVSKSGLSKTEALEKIDKLQKDILALQTVKEFVKSSYEGGLTRYWEIENQINDMQGEVSRLQDEFGEGMVIEDDEARTLMAAAALKSCQDTLASLREKQKKSADETKTEQRRIREAFDKFRSLQKEILPDKTSERIGNEFSDELGILSRLEEGNVHDSEELKSIEAKVKEDFDAEANASLTVTEMAERMDQLVNKVIGLETDISSQHALIESLRAEADDLHAQIQMLENEKPSFAKGSDINVGQKMRAVKEKFDGIQDLNRNVKQQNSSLQKHFAEAQCNLEHLSEKLHSVRPDEVQETISLNTDVEPAIEVKSSTQFKGRENEASAPERDQESQRVHPNGVRLDINSVEKQTDKVGVSDSLEKKEETLAQGEPSEQRRVSSSGHDMNGQKKEKTLAQGEPNEERQVFSAGHEINGVVDSKKDDRPSSEEDKRNSSPQDSSQKSDDNSLQIEAQEQKTEEPDEPNWKELFTQGLEDREKTLLTEYTSILRNYKEVRKKLSDAEKKNQDEHFETTVELKELKDANAMKEEEIRSLRQKLGLLQAVVEGNKDLKSLSGPNNSQEADTVSESLKEQEDDDDGVKLIFVDRPEETSETEQRLRMHIDQILEENLDFWLRFSAALHQIQKYETAVEDLQSELSKLEETVKKSDSSHGSKTAAKSDMKPICKHLREIHTELRGWQEKCLLLKDEQQSRFSSLCNIQEEITKAVKISAEDEDFKFTSYQAAKFQGEVLNMKQENNKVAGELQAGLDHIATLEAEVQKSLALLDGEFGISGPKDNKAPPLTHTPSKNRVPLRSFIFGVKQKRQKPSIFHYMNPAMHRKYNVFRSGFSGQVSS